MAQIVTQGQGEVRRIADRARVVVTFTGRAKDRGASVDALAARIAPVESLLTGDGVTVESRQLSVYDWYEGKRRSGAAASQHYTVLVTDLDRLNDLIAELVDAGPASLHGPMWELADRAEPFGEAQRIAVADARATARGYVDALAARLGPLLRLEDTPTAGRPVRYAALAASRSAPAVAELSLAPEEVVVSATCSVTWELLA